MIKHILSVYFSLCIGLSPQVTAKPLIDNHWNGKSYTENSQLQAHWADRFFFQNYVFSGREHVLDIGSGDGKLTARIADLVPNGKVIGIDNSPLMITEAKRKFSNRPNLIFKLRNAQDLDFYKDLTEKFDLIVSFSTLHWVNDQRAVLQGIFHSLKENGKFYLKLSSKGGDPIQDIADELQKSPKYKDYFRNFDDPMTRYSVIEYQALLKEAHLNLISIKDSEEKDKIIGKKPLIKQIKSWLPHYHYLKQHDTKVAEQYIEEVIDTYIERFPPTKEGIITLYDHYLEVVGEKNENVKRIV